MPPDSDDSGTPATSIPSDTATSCTDQPSHVQAPLMLTTVFPTWEDFGVYMDEYQRQTFQVYVYKTSTSVVNRNKTITRQKGKILIPLELKFYAKTLICTYGGKPQYRGKGIRPRQNYRPKECPARMNVLLKRRPGNCDFSKPSGWRIVVTHHRAVHNHPLNAESFLVHPRNRKVENPMVLEAVSALRKAGVKQGVIRNYISEKEPNKKVTQADVNNLLRRIQDNNFIVPLPSPAPQIARFTTEGEDRARNEQSSELVSTTPPIDNVGARDQAPTVNIDELPIIHECSPMESDGHTINRQHQHFLKVSLGTFLSN
ncbi:LOW QUALITY PROTEIN: hypothetical protein PHMEG_00011769 [Phytophthora megakarya]|uniref:ZSWIM3 N-terminal domain-containing protein n=1 Tax=Phytophthora megakarya TaxID=4795 RepID=A0A225WBF5_9STRA|nr:LOW QUALITY PROTEIN: hypothetical protein PHMEG_00011769 [Phytophthora megakarya]